MGRIMDLFRGRWETAAEPENGENAAFEEFRPVVVDADGRPVPGAEPPKGAPVMIDGRGQHWRVWRVYSGFSAVGSPFCSFYADLLETPGGVLVSGATGSGKSVVLNGILREILGTFCPVGAAHGKTCDIYLCDPKIVEFRAYKGLPHVKRYAARPSAIFSVMDEVDEIMMKRYENMAERGLKMWDGSPVFLFIDEIGDLMISHKKDFLPRLTHLLNLARAAKITVFVASQSPSRTTIPAPVQLNCTAKICLKCDTAIESRQVVGIPGAEELPPHGLAYVRTPKTGGIIKQEIPNCTDAEVERVLSAIRREDVRTIRKCAV